MSVFYIDSINGLDTNDGSTPGLAWRTLSRVKTLIAAKGLGPGDQVKFRRGGEYFGRLAPVGEENKPSITLTAYGTGPRPIISGYRVANQSGSWTQHSAGVWKIDISPGSSSVSGDVDSSGNTDVGFLKVDGKIRPKKYRTLANLVGRDTWSFTSDATFLYVVAPANPTTLALDIRIAGRGNILTPGSGVRISNLAIQGTGGHGIRPLPGVSHGGVITGNSVSECGGGWLYQDSTTDNTRFGNGIEIWIGARNWLVEHNEISDCYDVGFTLQGSATSGGINSWSDIAFRNNRVWNCSQAVEFWCSADGFTGNGFVRVKVTGNELLNGGYSWGESVPTNSGNRGVTWLSYAMDLPVDIESSRNIIVSAKAAYKHHRRNINGVNDYRTPAGWVFKDNLVVLDAGTKMRYSANPDDVSTATIETASSWANSEGVEKGTAFMTMPTSLVSSSNWLEDVQAFMASKAAIVDFRSQNNVRALDSMAGRLTTLEAESTSALGRGLTSAPARGTFWYMPEVAVSTTLAGSTVVNRLHLVPLKPAASGHVEAVGVEVTSAGSTGSLIKLLAYREEGGSLQQITNGTISGEATGVVELPTDFFTREGEYLWVGMIVVSGPTTLPTVRAATGPSSSRIPIPVASSQFGYSSRVNGITISGVTGSPPVSIPLGSTGLTTIVPVIGIKTSTF